MRLPRLAMETTFSPLAFAQRAFCAAAIRARPAAESFLRDVFLSVPLSVAIALVRRSSCDVRRLCSCRSCARTTLRLDMQGIVTLWRAELLQQTGNAPKCRATNREFRGTELPARWKNTTRGDLADFEGCLPRTALRGGPRRRASQVSFVWDIFVSWHRTTVLPFDSLADAAHTGRPVSQLVIVIANSQVS